MSNTGATMLLDVRRREAAVPVPASVGGAVHQR
jgi:hypothetical protein